MSCPCSSPSPVFFTFCPLVLLPFLSPLHLFLLYLFFTFLSLRYFHFFFFLCSPILNSFSCFLDVLFINTPKFPTLSSSAFLHLVFTAFSLSLLSLLSHTFLYLVFIGTVTSLLYLSILVFFSFSLPCLYCVFTFSFTCVHLRNIMDPFF